MIFVAAAGRALAQPADRPNAAGKLQLESVRLSDGKEYRGLVQSAGTKTIDFAEIFRPAGKPMYAVIRGIERQSVAELKQFSPTEHARLVERFSAFRNRAVIEAGLLDQVQLQNEDRQGVSYRVYRGDWFELLSTTDDEAARLCVVRIEQIFRAYRTLLPPRLTQVRQLTVQLYGSMADYRARLRELDISITNPACYVPDQHLILAGSELSAFGERLAQTRQENESLREQYARLDVEFVKGLNRLSNELKAAGVSAAEIAAELRLRKGAWKNEMDAVLTKATEADRRNAAKFREVSRQMFARLNHEAFHAYLDLYVYPHESQHVPRWLNEGLAQIFEHALLDGDTLRIDAPARDRLAALQKDPTPLSLAALLQAHDQEFLAAELATHHGVGNAQRNYLYAWALAYYLAFHENLLGGEALDGYVAPLRGPQDPLGRFEQLSGIPLNEFEARFRRTMLGLKK